MTMDDPSTSGVPVPTTGDEATTDATTGDEPCQPMDCEKFVQAFEEDGADPGVMAMAETICAGRPCEACSLDLGPQAAEFCEGTCRCEEPCVPLGSDDPFGPLALCILYPLTLDPFCEASSMGQCLALAQHCEVDTCTWIECSGLCDGGPECRTIAACLAIEDVS